MVAARLPGLHLGSGYRNRLTDRAGLQFNPSPPRKDCLQGRRISGGIACTISPESYTFRLGLRVAPVTETTSRLPKH